MRNLSALNHDHVVTRIQNGVKLGLSPLAQLDWAPLATKVARMLHGKDNPAYSVSGFGVNHVVVINADKVRMTGNKVEQKIIIFAQRVPHKNPQLGEPSHTKTPGHGVPQEQAPARHRRRRNWFNPAGPAAGQKPQARNLYKGFFPHVSCSY